MRTDTERFEQLYNEVRPRAERLALKLSHYNQPEAEDLLQEATVRAWKSFPTFRGDGLFKSWFYQILYNEASDRYRKKRLCVNVIDGELSSQTPDNSEPIEDIIVRQSLARSLVKQLLRLRPQQRELLVLRYVEDWSLIELARYFGVEEGTIKSRISRAKESILRRVVGPPC